MTTSFRSLFPNGCCGFCKPTQIQKQITETVLQPSQPSQLDVKKVLPYGFIKIYPGVRTTNGKYTSPMLSVHLYRQLGNRSNVMKDERTVAITGSKQEIAEGPKEMKRIENSLDEEELISIPVEDVTIISARARVEKGVQQDVKMERTPVFELSENCCDRCADSIAKCCRGISDKLCSCCKKPPKIASLVVRKNEIEFDPNRSVNYEEEDIPAPKEQLGCCQQLMNKCRCWCCRRKILVSFKQKKFIDSKRDAKRVVTVQLQYSKYSHLDSASNARLLSEEDQKQYYRSKFNPNTEIEFYLINDQEYVQDNFNLKREQAETLCRTIMQLKAMKDNYPSEGELATILDSPYKRSFGDQFIETALALPFGSTNQALKNHQHQPLPAPPATIVNERKIDDHRQRTTVVDDILDDE